MTITDNVNEVQSGDTFYAIKGVNVDGADFVHQAVQKGATKIVADHMIDCDVSVQVVEDVRHTFAVDCTKKWPSEKIKKVAVTGTNGKTSTVYFVQQLMNLSGVKAVSLGTIGLDGCMGHTDSSMTTMPPKLLSETLSKLQSDGVEVVAMEASSHGLDQDRLAGLSLCGGGFTNITRDHMDYHKTQENYLSAKEKLFTKILPENSVAVLNADIDEYEHLKQVCQQRGQKIISYGVRGETLRLMQQVPTSSGQHIVIQYNGQNYPFNLSVFGDFQAMNLLCAIGLCLSLGQTWEQLSPVIEQVKAPAGRLEFIGSLNNGAGVFVDYAHTPDGLKQVLKSLRPHTKGRLVCLFGCGGDRDKGKRIQMGQVAQEYADDIFVTDDNPRSEDPSAIRQEILAGCPSKGHEELSRSRAIMHAVNLLQEGDILVLAGKGHEDYQQIQKTVYPFSDRIEAALQIKGYNENALYNGVELQQALNVPVHKKMKVWRVVFNSQDIQLGDLFVALTGGKRDGHEFVKDAVKRGAALCLVNHEIADVSREKQLIVSDTRMALESLARYARMRSMAQVVGITGSSGKTTTKEMLGACLQAQGKTFITKANLNNDLGVALMLANLPADTQYAVIEMGISHVGEMTELSDLVRPDVSIITNIHPAHQEFFKTLQMTAEEKAHIFDYQDKNGTAVLSADTDCAQDLFERAHLENIKHIVRFGKTDSADLCLKDTFVQNQKMYVKAHWHGDNLSYTLNFIGTHYALDSLAVLGAVDALGASTLQAVQTLQTLNPTNGRGYTQKINVDDKEITLIDDAYNANPASMKAGLESLSFYTKRKIAVLGDMLELGEEGQKRHLDLLDILSHNGVEKVFAVGNLMRPVFELLPEQQQGAWCETVEQMMPVLLNSLQNQDIVYIKSSHGMGLYKLVDKLKGK